MLHFLRRIRKQLIESGKAREYAAYAIGEIVLVVVGILIALQLNNLNENRKNRAFEKEILQQIRENLDQDRASLKSISKSFERAVSASEKLVNRDLRLSNPDSVPFWLGDVVKFERFRPITNSYETLKSRGLDNLRDKSLRKLLGEYYDDQAYLLIEGLEDIEYSFNLEWLPLMHDHVADFKFKKHLYLKDQSEFFEKTNAVRILILNRDNYGAGNVNVRRAIRDIDRILDLIQKDAD